VTILHQEEAWRIENPKLAQCECHGEGKEEGLGDEPGQVGRGQMVQDLLQNL
jgi:hypothetical protein